MLLTDVCLCEYTSHGHCGLVEGDEVLNDVSLELLAKTAVSHAEAGADAVCPSDMLDGRVSAIRGALDGEGFEQLSIVAYSAKYASPSTAHSARRPSRRPPSATAAATRWTRRTSAALRECEPRPRRGRRRDHGKAGDSLPRRHPRVRERFDAPLFAYNVSGEYAMVKAAAASGWLDERQAAVEGLTAIKRAGADVIVSYWARELAEWL